MDVRFLLNYLPPLSDFVLFCLTSPTPPKIGHHLCTFPNYKLQTPFIKQQFHKKKNKIVLRIFFGHYFEFHYFLWNCCLWDGVSTVHVPKKGNAYLDGTVHVAKEVQTIQRFLLEPYMWEKRYEPNSGTVHVAKCSSLKSRFLSLDVTICYVHQLNWGLLLRLICNWESFM